MDYNKIADNVLRVLTKSGRPVTLRQQSVGAGGYDPSAGKVASATPVDTTRYVLTADQPGTQIAQRFGQSLNANTLVQKSEKWIYMDAKGPKPGLQDKVIFDGVTYSVIDVQEQKPGLVTLYYMLVLRA